MRGLRSAPAPIVLPATALVLALLVALGTHAAPVAHAGAAIGGLVGAGLWSTLLCVGCVAAIVAAAGPATPLAIAIVVGVYPVETAACVTTCLLAAR